MRFCIDYVQQGKLRQLRITADTLEQAKEQFYPLFRECPAGISSTNWSNHKRW